MTPKRCRLTRGELDLRDRIMDEMKRNGFQINPHLRLPDGGRQAYRYVQQKAKIAQIREHGRFITKFLPRAKELYPDATDIRPEDIELEIRPVRSGTHDGRLFFWWNLAWWSMPYQKAYGRQMRFIIWDVTHDAPFGIIQLQSPLLRMSARDKYLDIPRGEEDYWANMSMNAGRIGALPPYNGLIGGKMAALAVTSNEVRAEYKERYGGGRRTLMEGRTLPPNLLFVTTTSAFGRSSMYDRLRYGDRLAAICIGSTSGAGTFHVPESLTRDIYAMLKRDGVDTSTSYGHGPSRKLKLFKLAFRRLGLKEFYNHGIRRGVYLFPLAENLHEIIRDDRDPVWIERPFADLARYWKKRWAVPRGERIPAWREFDAAKFFGEVAAWCKKV